MSSTYLTHAEGDPNRTEAKGEEKFLQGPAMLDALPGAAGPEMLRLTTAQVLFRQGDASDAMYVVVAGQVDVTVTTQDGEERVLCTLEAGAILGEISLLLDEPRTATVVARSNTELRRISRNDFESALGLGDPWTYRFLLVIARKLAGRLVDVNREVLALAGGAHDRTNRDDNVKVTKATELEQLRDRLFTHWSF